MEKVTCLIKDFGNPGNGRVYTKEAMEMAVKEYLSREDKTRRLGEMDPRPDEDPWVHLSNVSHMIEDVRFEGDKLYGDIELLDTPNGKMAQELLKNGLPIHLAPRMTAQPIYEIDEEGNETNKIIGYKDLSIISMDIMAP